MARARTTLTCAYLNVALTRARRRLIVLGDFEWAERHANREASRSGRSWSRRMTFPNLDVARQRVVIYSPFLTPDRVAMLEPHVRGAVERGVRLYLVTKTLGERSAGAAASARPVEEALARWGVTVLHKFHMHEKLVFIDEDIAPSVSQSSPTPAGGRLAQS